MTTKTIKVSHDLILSTEQAIDRYHLLAKKAEAMEAMEDMGLKEYIEETKELVDKIYDGSVDKLFAALLGRKKLSAEQIQKLKQIVEDLE